MAGAVDGAKRRDHRAERECHESTLGGASSDDSGATTPRQKLRERRGGRPSESPSTRPGIAYTLADCRGRWSYLVSEGSPHIQRGYRLGLSFTQCVQSMFQLHNETINVWSHLVGALLFVSLVFYVTDSPAFERPRAVAQATLQSAVGSITFLANFNSSISEQEFCGSDDALGAGWNPSGGLHGAGEDALANPGVAEAAARNRTQTCKRRNEQLAFTSAHRHFAAAKKILQHVEFKLPGLERWRKVIDTNMMDPIEHNWEMPARVAREAQHMQQKLDEAMLNLEESLTKIRAELALLGRASMDGCVLCWVELVHRLAGVRSALQDQMTAIKEQMADINGLSNESGGSATGEDAAWGLSPREWADYTLSEVASVSAALNSGIAASKRALMHASSRLHHELLQDVYGKMSEMGTRELLLDIFPDSLVEKLQVLQAEIKSGSSNLHNGTRMFGDARRFSWGGVGEGEGSMERWPIVAFLLSAVTCLTTSASYHLFNCHSRAVGDMLLLLDYAGISVLIGGSFLPPIYYGFYCDAGLRTLYLTLIITLSLLSCIVGIYSGLWPSARNKFVRVVSYSANALFAIFPCGHLVIRCALGQPVSVTALLYIAGMLALYSLGSVIYFYQFPERIWPGRFDLVLSSHQLWHLIVFAAAFMHYFCAVGHFHWRAENRCPLELP